MSENLRDGTLLGNTSGNGRYDSDDNGGDDLSDLWLPSTSNGNGHANGRPISTWTRDVLEVPSDGKDPIWGSPPLPDKFSTLYPWQVDALERVMEAYANGARVVLLEAATGAGKGCIGECTRRLSGGSGIYLAETFDLQQQMDDSFPYAEQLRGRSNYPTLNYPQLFRDKWNPLSCAECTKQKVGEDDEDSGEWQCDFCSPVSSCRYEVAKNKALYADLAILNYSYFLTEANGPGRFAKREFCIADEADRLEAVLLGYASVTISSKMIAELGIEPPSHKTKSDKTDTEVWPQWVKEEAIPRVLAGLKRYPPSNDVKTIRKRNQLLRLLKQLHQLAEDLPLGNYVYDGWKYGGAIEFKPIRVDKLAGPLLFDHAKRWLLMSATILEPNEMRDSLGITEEMCPLPESFVVMPWVFPAKNRPIYYIPKLAVDMTNKNKDESWPKMAESVGVIVDQHPNDRILIHTVSYCVDEETEITTSEGWKKYSDLRVGDSILTLNHDTGLAEWQPCEAVHIFPEETRQMISIEHGRHSSLTTPNHKWPVRKYHAKDRSWEENLWATSAELKSSHAVSIIAPISDLPVEPKYSDAFVETVAWFWTEGHEIDTSNAVSLAQKNELGKKRIRSALYRWLGSPVDGVFVAIPPTTWGTGRISGPPAWRESKETRDPRRSSFRLNASAGKLLREVAPHRLVSYEFLTSLTQAQLELYIDTSLLAEQGICKSKQIVLGQADKGRAERFQFACILSGRAARLRSPTSSSPTMWMVNVYETQQTWLNQKHNKKEVLHHGIVWCPQTRNHTWLARRKGTIYFTGNSLSNYLIKTIDNPRLMTYTKSSERQEILDQYKATPGAVLVASSFDRGISLDDDLGRVVIVCKIPWGNIGDKQIAARMYTKGGKLWYATQTIRTLVQMCGRTNRHIADHSEIFILDRQFVTRIWKDYKHLLPQGWKDALDSEESGIVWR